MIEKIEASVLLDKMRINPKAYPLMLLNPNMSLRRHNVLRQRVHIIPLVLYNTKRFGVVRGYSKVETKPSQKVKSELGFSNIFEENVSITMYGPGVYFLPDYPQDLIDKIGLTFDIQLIPNVERHAVMIAYMPKHPLPISEESHVTLIGRIE